MGYRRLFLFVEGDDDERFVRAVVEPRLRGRYEHVEVVKFSRLKREKVAGLLRSVAAMGSDYLLLRDLDHHPCASAAKATVERLWPRIDPGRVQIVRAEIESWYCAGIPAGDPELGALDLATCADTETVTQETFDAELTLRRRYRNELMIAILERFDLETAVHRNNSFAYFVRKHLGGGVEV